MRADWTPLNEELRHWRRAGLKLPIWWRDDDAIAATPALDRLRALAEDLQMPVHIAVIPDLVSASLAPDVATHPVLIPVIHGWRHRNHAPRDAKKAEFGGPRTEAPAEIRAGLTRLRTVFGARLTVMFVPPWNRIDPGYLPVLADAGYRAVSTFRPRVSAQPVERLWQINTHLDPIFWKGHRSLVDPDRLIADLVGDLQDRRHGRTDMLEPYGLLTHHLVHDADIWAFTHACLATLLSGGAIVADPLIPDAPIP